MMNFRRILYVVLVLILTQSCGSNKKIVQVIPDVEWAKNRPRSQSYYVGIGQADKVGSPNDYMQVAKQNALADMASEISISISANSVISAFETKNVYSEDFTSTVKAETQKELDGYELVETWDGNTQYWAYYRLSKSHYKNMVEEKKAAAGIKSVDFYAKALQSISGGDVRTGLVMLVKALEPIRPYFAETISVMFNGQEIFIGNEIINKFTETVNSLAIAGVKSIDAKLGAGIHPKDLTYTVVDVQGEAQRGILLRAVYTEKPIQASRAVTGSAGKAGFSIDAVRSSKIMEHLTVSIDLDNIVREGTAEPVLKRLLTKVSTPSFTTAVNVIKPNVFVEANADANCQVLVQAVKSGVTAQGLPVVDNKAQADYSIAVSAEQNPPVKTPNLSMVSLVAVVVVNNSSGVEVYRRTLDNIRGSHFDMEQARGVAFAEAAKRIESTITREIVEGVIKGRKSY